MTGSLQYTNIQRFENMPWQEYVKLPGYSYSFLKNEKGGSPSYFTATDKMKLGSLVDALLMQQDEVDMKSPLFPAARNVASKILSEFGTSIARFKSQMSYTADITYAGLTMTSKGRSDWELPKLCVVDLKVTEATDLQALIDFMGYQHQQNNYAAMAQVPNAYILAYNVKWKKCMPLVSLPVSMDNEFWKNKVLKFGKV